MLKKIIKVRTLIYIFIPLVSYIFSEYTSVKNVVYATIFNFFCSIVFSIMDEREKINITFYKNVSQANKRIENDLYLEVSRNHPVDILIELTTYNLSKHSRRKKITINFPGNIVLSGNSKNKDETLIINQHQVEIDLSHVDSLDGKAYMILHYKLGLNCSGFTSQRGTVSVNSDFKCKVICQTNKVEIYGGE
ncbi:hypothetical protein D7I45_06140 [Apilactobacillus bombintestini]|uniref:Uncharacterized protein n=2 Tax=Apilactobacillus bombintestini TaxID=2419772 RepID=A0A387B1Q2_9LACO|nr:hypothetical protein D7I45_06140 [Apilactobacillus bombintestini]